ncbi:hypothetical protein LIER_10688 [Lithospermum erythrorhizon]|uniref:Uncharacterized protein n=1 Tax=Lithospermum erythrorhizon TaxID=34254 RepID=A0AAV3PLQ4_LITER
MIIHGSVNNESHASNSTPALRSLHRRSAMEEGNEDFVGSLLRDSPETTSPPISTNLDDSQVPLDVVPINSWMGPPADVPLYSNPIALHPEPSKDKSLKEQLERVKGGFSYNVCAHWSLSNSTLASEDSTMTQAEVDKLRVGFPKALHQEVFCDRDVLIKAVNFKVVTSRKDPLVRISKRKGKSACESSSETLSVAPPPKKSKKAPKISAPVVDLPPVEVSTKIFEPLLPYLPDPVTIILSDRVVFEEAPVSEPSLPFFTPEGSSTYNGPLFEVPYSLPSGLTVTEGTVSRKDAPTAFLLLKNCMLKRDMKGVLQYSTQEDLHDSFSHFQLKAIECAYGLSLKWREHEESRARLESDKTSLEKRWLRS